MYFENPAAPFPGQKYDRGHRSSRYDITGVLTGDKTPQILLHPVFVNKQNHFPDVLIDPGRGGFMARPANFKPPTCRFVNSISLFACQNFQASWMEVLVFQEDGTNIPATKPIGGMDTYWQERGDPRSSNNLTFFGFVYELQDDRKKFHVYSHRRPLLAYRHYHFFFDKNQPVLPRMKIKIWDALTKEEVYWLSWHKFDTSRVPVVEYNCIRPIVGNKAAVREVSLDKLIASTAQVAYTLVGEALTMKIHAICDRPGLVAPLALPKNVEVYFKYAKEAT